MSFLRGIALDTRISIKIGAASVVAILLLVAIVVSQFLGDAAIRAAKDGVDREQTIVADVIDAKASIRGMQMGVRDIRLAATPDDMKRAMDFLEARRNSATRFVDQAISMARAAGRKGDNLQRLKALIADYAAGGKQMESVRAEAIALQAKGEIERAALLNTQAANIARERTLPIATEMEKLATAAVNVARAEAKVQNGMFSDRMQFAEYSNAALAGLAILVLIGTGIFMLFTVTRPLRALTGGMRELASGNFEVVLPGVGRKDEVGEIAGAVDEFKARLAEKMRLEAEKEQEIARREQAERDERARREAEQARMVAEVVSELGQGLENLAKGNLTYRVSKEFTTEYKKVQDDFNSAITQLQDTVQRIATSSTEISNAAAEISTATTDLSQRTEEQAASLEETSASMEEIAATVKRNAENAQQACSLTRNTQEVANRSGEVVAQAVSAMSRIEDSSRKISDIISVIDEIARQTNLLALNAAVEAARAGEAGRGFAVVASEVRSLAQRSSQAAKDIKDLIVNSSNQVGEGVELVNKAGESLKDILNSINHVAAIVSDIANASTEQAAGIEQINKALNQMDEVTQQNSALVEENAATAKTLADQSTALDGRVSVFQLGEDQPVIARATVSAAPRAVPARPAPKAKTLVTRGPARQMQAALATAIAKDEWEEF
jgi:methyl-accepting chemotaxis protein